MKRKILLGVLVLCALLALLNLDRLAYYRALLTWRAQGIHEYEMIVEYNSSWPQFPLPTFYRRDDKTVSTGYFLHVRDGRIISTDNLSEQLGERWDFLTVEGQFDSIEQYINRDWLDVLTGNYLDPKIDYDRDRGYPLSLQWHSDNITDSDSSLRITRLTVIKAQK